ncbi:LamG domain-containing protein [bacterium]|nr:LamG domain-containing protein [bacterium]
MLFSGVASAMSFGAFQKGLVGHWKLSEESETTVAMTGDAWQNSTASGRESGTNYFSQTGDVIEVTSTSGSWNGAGKMFTTNRKGKYAVRMKVNLNNGKFRSVLHLYSGGSRVNYDGTQVPVDSLFTANHVAGFNQGQFATAGEIEKIVILDLSNAPDFDAIHIGITSELGTSSPYLSFDQNDIWVKEIQSSDSSTSDFFGKLNSAVSYTTDRNGNANAAMDFDGVADLMTVENSENLEPGDGDFTISLWMKTTDTAGNVIVKDSGSGARFGFYLAAGWGGNCIFWFNDSTRDGGQYAYAGYDATDGDWHHVAAVLNRNTQKIISYSDGDQWYARSFAGFPNSELGSVSNAASVKVGSSNFDGEIADVRIYNRALSATEISQLAAGSGSARARVGNFSKKLIGHWKLSQENYNTATYRVTDSSAYDHHGLNLQSGGAGFTTGHAGTSGGAMDFDWTNSEGISVADADGHLALTNTDDFTISVWVKKTGEPTEGNVMGIVGKSVKYGIDYAFGTDELRAGIRNGPDGAYLTTLTGHTLNDWTHVVMVYASETADGLRLYVDGSRQNSRTTVGLSDFSTTNSLYIGKAEAFLAGTPKSFQGNIDDVRIYKRALTDAEISALHESSTPRAIVE